MGDAVEARAALVVSVYHIPGTVLRIRGRKHGITRPGIIIPATVAFEIHRAKLPDLAQILVARLQPHALILHTDFQPVLYQDYSRVDNSTLDGRRILQEGFHLFRRGKPHHPLHTRAVVPAAVKDHHFAGSRQMRNVALDVHLRLLALGRRRQRHDAEDARAGAFRDPLDDATLAGRVASFEQHADLGPADLDPLLQLDELNLKGLQLPFKLLVAHALRRLFDGLQGSFVRGEPRFERRLHLVLLLLLLFLLIFLFAHCLVS